jgi:FkbM family methyltransferase
MNTTVRNRLLELTKRLFHSVGLEIGLLSSGGRARFIQLLKALDINCVLDVGANNGKYAMQLRSMGYMHRIVSFEPLNDEFQQLTKFAQRDGNWDCFNFALGDEVGQLELNVSGNSYSSSFLQILDRHTTADPRSVYVRTQTAEIKTLDSIFEDICSNDDRILLKIDTQGFEKHVIDGASKSLCKINLLQLESSIQKLYEGEMLVEDMISYVKKRNFSLVSIEPGFCDASTGELLQADLIFKRNM